MTPMIRASEESLVERKHKLQRVIVTKESTVAAVAVANCTV